MIYIDTNILVYLLEGHPVYAKKVADKLTTYKQNGHEFVTSTIAISEFLAGTKSVKSNEMLMALPGFRYEHVSILVAEKAGSLMKKNPSLKIGDTLHLATATLVESDAFFTNDKKLAKIAATYLKVETL